MDVRRIETPLGQERRKALNVVYGGLQLLWREAAAFGIRSNANQQRMALCMDTPHNQACYD